MEDSGIQLVTFEFADGSKYGGTILLSLDNSFQLDIDDLPEPEQGWSNDTQIIAYGKRNSDKYIFSNLIYHGQAIHRMHKSNPTTTTRFTALLTISGDEDSPLSKKVSSMDVMLENLDLWFGKSLFEVGKMHYSEDNHLKYKMSEDVGHFKFGRLGVTFNLSIGEVRYDRVPRKISFNQGGHISLHVLEGEDDIDYEEMLGILRSIESIIGLAYRAHITANELSVTSKSYPLKAQDNNAMSSPHFLQHPASPSY
jgi:hypothetical protein